MQRLRPLGYCAPKEMCNSIILMMADLNEAKEQQSLRYFLTINCSPENAKSNGSHRNGSAFKQKKISFKKMQAAANQKQQHPKNSSAMITKLNQNWKPITRSIEEKKACSFIWSKNGSVCQVERIVCWEWKKTWRKKWMHPSKKIHDQWTYQYLICLIKQNLAGAIPLLLTYFLP